MSAAWLRGTCRALLAVLPLVCAAPAQGASPERFRADSPEALLDQGMPLAARREFLALSPGSRGKSPVLPKLMRRLAESGRADLALSLFEEARPLLSESVRPDAFFEAGRILWERKEHGKAAEAFRRAIGKPGVGPQAAMYLARSLAASGNSSDAMEALSAVPAGGKRSLIAGEIEMTRRNQAGAVAAWAAAPTGSAAGFAARIHSLSRAEGRAGAARELRATADNASAGAFPERAASLEALSLALLARKGYDGALAAARDALSAAERWKASAGKPPEWDGTPGGAESSWKSLASLFPYDEDAGKFLSAGRRFLAVSTLHETLRRAEAANVEISRRVAAARERVSLRKKAIAGKIERSEEIRKAMLDARRRAAETRNRLRQAADSLPLPAWGAGIDPRHAALLDEVVGKLSELRDRLARVRAAANAATENEGAGQLPPEDRRMLFYARQRVARVEDRINALEGRTAFLRAKIWNRWKAAYAARLSVQIEKAQRTAKAAAEAAAMAEKGAFPLREAQAELSAWENALDRFRKRLARDAATLKSRRAETRAAADRAFSEARMELVAAIAGEEAGMRYLAARAATEWRIADQGPTSGSASLSPSRRQELLREAIRHWEAILPSPGERDVFADEALCALAELRFEEAESRFQMKEEAGGAVPDVSAPVALFRRVIDEFPDSPYSEQAYYGLALSYQEGGAADNAAAAMKALLARHPGTRFADEVHLRLGEYAFDETDFREAEEAYRKVSTNAPPEIRVTSLFKLGWSLFLQGRPKEAVEPFLSALLLSPAARKTGGVPREALAMAARSLVEANMDTTAENLLAQRDASVYGPSLLLRMQEILDGQNRYDDAAAIADRIARAYPMAAERLDAELAAVEALRKAGKEEDSHVRRGRFHRIFGPGSAWQTFSARAPAEVARANVVSEEGLRSAAFYLHARSREAPPGDRLAVLALYDASLSLFPSSPKAEEIAYQRAWLLFEDGRKKEAGAAFEGVALRPGGARGEASWYMAVQCAKDLSSPSDPKSQAEVVRLCREYERSFPAGERIVSILLDRARAHANLRRFADAAGAADRAAGSAKAPPDIRAALRLAGDARFEAEDFEGAEKAFRALLAAGPPPEEAKEAEKWIAFSMFRRAEKMPRERSAGAAALFSRVDKEFPSLEIAPVARLRAGTSYAAAGKTAEAIAAFRSVESAEDGSSLSLDAVRWLARLYETSGEPLAAAERYERLGARGNPAPEEKTRNLLRAAELYSMGKDEARSRKNLLAVASLPGVPADLRVQSLYRAGESARMEGNAGEADRYYEETVAAHRAAPAAAPELAGRALFHRAEFRFRVYRTLSIAPPLEKTFAAKQASLEGCAKLYLEAIRWGDAPTVSASLHRLGEAFEDFRSAILSSPPPQGLSSRERDEYVFLLEEKAAPIEEKAVEAYLKNLRQAVAADSRSEWSEKSLQRLKALRPARFGKTWEYAFPVMTVPDFRGMIERNVP